MADGGFSHRVTPGEVEALIRRLTANLNYTLTVPGTRSNGLTNQALLEILAEHGRDFAKNNATLRRHVATTCRLAFEGATRLPTRSEIEAVERAAIIDWILKRFRYEVRDVRIKLNTNRYQRAKARAGFDGPVGIRTGELVDAVANARVTLRSP